jgi:hypothetical protein
MLNAENERLNSIKQLTENNDLQFFDIRTKIFERDEFTLSLMSEVITDAEAHLFSLGLEEDQEKS